MEYYSKITILDWFSISVEITLALLVLFKIKNIKLKCSFLAAALISALWHITLSASPLSPVAMSWQFQLLEILRYLCWLLVLVYLLMLSRQRQLAVKWERTLSISILVCLSAFGYSLTRDLTEFPYGQLGLYLKLLCCLFIIVLAEQLIRHQDSSRIAKLLGLAAITLFAYDIVVISNLLLFTGDNTSLWRARGLVSSAACLVIALSLICYADQLKQPGKFKLSNSVILFNASFTLAGSFLLLMSLLGTVFKLFDVSWADVSQILFYVMALFIIATLSCSEKIRQRLVVWTSKHFFSHKYDYKDQWINLDALLSKETKNSNGYETVLTTFSSLFDCDGGGIWIRGQQFFSSVALKNLNVEFSLPLAANDSDFIRTLEQQDWIFQVCKHSRAADTKYNARLPDWLVHIEHLWTVVPLNSAQGLIGFAVLCKKAPSPLSWEDIDILKLTGRQLASYISHLQASEKLNQNQQFDIFNKITAFAIHDIKNLIAQQSLVVKNAEKFKHNPQFVDDVIVTIRNSVATMDQLLIKLMGNSPSRSEMVNFNQILRQAIDMSASASPVPKVSIQGPNAHVKADKDKLLMAMNHLIKNAQDATDDEGSIEVTLNTNHDALWLEVTDTGAGMDQTFIKDQLFKPFTTTKPGQGMGIGAFQIRELIHSLQGELFVESSLGQGSKFSIYLPLKTAPAQ